MTRLLAFVLLSFAACQPAPVGVRDVALQPDSTPQCASLCQQIGLPLDSVVIMANNVGCVCRAVPPPMAAPPAAAPTTTPPGASASAGGMAAVLMAEQARQEEESRRSSSSIKRPYTPPPTYSPTHH